MQINKTSKVIQRVSESYDEMFIALSLQNMGLVNLGMTLCHHHHKLGVKKSSWCCYKNIPPKNEFNLTLKDTVLAPRGGRLIKGLPFSELIIVVIIMIIIMLTNMSGWVSNADKSLFSLSLSTGR